MKQHICIFSVIFLMFGAWALAETPQWIQSEERLVGENSTLYEDTLNRPTKTIWNTYLIGHNTDGTHTITAADIGALPKITFDNYTSHTHPLPTLGELGAAAVTHTHPLPTLGELGAAAVTHTHPLPTLGELGAASQTDLTTLQSAFSTLDAIDSATFEAEHNADGTHNFVIPPSGGSWGLESAAPGVPALSFALPALPWVSSGAAQITVAAKPAAYGVAGQFVGITNDSYSCARLLFGKDSQDKLFLTVGTDLYDDIYYSILCADQTYVSSFTLSNDGQYHEYGVQVDPAASVTFYLDGIPDAGTAMTGTMDLTPYDAETFSLGTGFQGILSSVKIGGLLTWSPTIARPISQEGLLFPGAYYLFALNEGEGSAVAREWVSGGDKTVDAGWTWVQLPGAF